MEVAQSAVVPVKSRPSVPRCSAGTEELSANLDGPMYGAASNIVGANEKIQTIFGKVL